MRSERYNKRKIELIYKLILDAQSGDKKSLEKIIIEFKPLIKNRATYYSKNNFECEDIKQIAIVGIIKAIRKLDLNKGDNFLAYIKKTVEHEIWKSLRKEHKVGRIIEKELYEVSKLSTLDIYIQKERLREINRIINELDYEEKELIIYLYSQGGSLRQYAKIKNKKYHNLRYKKEKILERIRNIYGRRFDYKEWRIIYLYYKFFIQVSFISFIEEKYAIDLLEKNDTK